MGKPRKFSRFLSWILIAFEAITLAIVVGCLYTLLTTTMERDFRHTTEVRQVETAMLLYDRIDGLMDRLRDMAASNTIRVSLMLGVKSQLYQTLRTKYPPSDGAFFFIVEKGTSEFVPKLTRDFLPVKDRLLNLIVPNAEKDITFQKLPNGQYIALFSMPIRRRLERLGTAYLVYDIASDKAFWAHMKLFGPSSLLVLEGSRLINLSTSGHELSLDSQLIIGDYREVDGKFIIPLKGFPKLFYCVSSSPLIHEKHKLMGLLFVLCTGIFFLTVALSLIISRKVSRPLEAISAQALEIAKDPTKAKIDEKGIGHLEFRNLVRAFNEVLTALVAAREKLKQKAREKILEGEERYRKTFEASPYSITISTIEDGRFVEVNSAFCTMSGYTREEAIGKTAETLGLYVSPKDRDSFLQILRLKGEVNNLELDFRRKDGRVFTGLLSARRLRYGNQECMVAIVTDITQQKKAREEKDLLESQLRQAQKMEAIGTLAGGVAHDFRNILQAISGYSDILLLDLKKGEKGWDEIREIQKAAKRASELTQQLLTFSRKVESRLRPTDINQEIRQAVKLLSRTLPKTIKIELQLEEDIHRVNADPAQIEQVLLNLGINAKDAMPNGGDLIIETQNILLDEQYCKCHAGARPGKYVLLEVADTGQGMDAETLEHIFEPFYTTKGSGKGTGLGLAMVYGIVKNHNGYIMCYSEPGVGTSFKIYLPPFEQDDNLVTLADGSKRTIPMGQGETVLVVDDDEAILSIVRKVLERFNYKTFTAQDPKLGLKLYKERQRQIDLVILDYMMPGMDGAAFLKEVIKINPQAKIIMTSGYPLDRAAKKYVTSNVTGFLKKPFEIETMMSEISKILQKP